MSVSVFKLHDFTPRVIDNVVVILGFLKVGLANFISSHGLLVTPGLLSQLDAVGSQLFACLCHQWLQVWFFCELDRALANRRNLFYFCVVRRRNLRLF